MPSSFCNDESDIVMMVADDWYSTHDIRHSLLFNKNSYCARCVSAYRCERGRMGGLDVVRNKNLLLYLGRHTATMTRHFLAFSAMSLEWHDGHSVCYAETDSAKCKIVPLISCKPGNFFHFLSFSAFPTQFLPGALLCIPSVRFHSLHTFSVLIEIEINATEWMKTKCR